MSRLSKSEALEDISTWTTTKVVELLKNNGVQQACWEVVERRKIDGDELLHLTEGKLALWKNDLATPLRRTLWTFVEQLKTSPEKYVEAKQKPPAEPEPPPPALTIEAPTSTHTETESDTGWDTDFEDEPAIEMKCNNSDFRNSLRIFQENDRLKIENDAATSRRGSSLSINKFDQPNNQPSPPSLEDSSTYANCETTYANVGYAEDTPELPKNLSKLHTELQKSLAEKLKEQLLLRGTSLEMPLNVKPTVAPKPEGLGKKVKEEVILRRSEPRTSFLHKKSNGTSGGKKTKMTVAPPSQPTTPPNKQSDDSLRNLPKPPGSIGFDLVENLPIIRPTDDSDDDEEEDYEAFDEQIVEQHQRNSLMSRTDSGQSLSSPDRNSIGSAYHPASSVSHDEEYGVYGEIYESIPEQNERDNNKAKNPANPPPPLPLKPPPNNTTLHNQLNKADSKSEPPPLRACDGMCFYLRLGGQLVGGLIARLGDEFFDMIVRIKRAVARYVPPPELPQERSLDKKSATLPHSGSNLSLNNAARPLPPPPELQDTYRDRPWYHQLTREQANLLIEEQSTYHNSPDGIFLMRPSTTNPDNPFTLVLWCKDRVYNVPVRRRPDNRYSLGKAKPEEQTFASVDEIVPFYKKEKLVLYTGGVQSGSTYLTEPPPKQKQNVF